MSQSDKSIWLRHIILGNTERAEECRLAIIPKHVCKFVSLSDEDSHITDDDKKRFRTLEDECVWVAGRDFMNDPCEFKGLYFDSERASGWGWDDVQLGIAERLMRASQTSLAFASFAELSALKSLPMWAHYANKHRGYCVVYKVIDPKHVFPVIYESQPVDATRVYCELLATLIQEIMGNGSADPHSNIALNLSTFQLLVKQSDWSYEREIRLLAPNIVLRPGYNVSVKSAGLETDHVVLGMNISEAHEDRVREICVNKLGCPLFKSAYSKTGFVDYREL